MIVSAAESRIESSGDQAMQVTGSACSRKIFSSVNPDCKHDGCGSGHAEESGETRANAHLDVPEHDCAVLARRGEPVAVVTPL